MNNKETKEQRNASRKGAETPRTDQLIESVGLEKYRNVPAVHFVCKEYAALERELEQLKASCEKDVFIPGVWQCPKCNYRVVKSNLYVQSGTVGPDTSPFVEKCPNDGQFMKPVKYRDEVAGWEKLADQLLKDKARLDWLQKNRFTALACHVPHTFMVTKVPHEGGINEDLRLAIDEAMKLNPAL